MNATRNAEAEQQAFFENACELTFRAEEKMGVQSHTFWVGGAVIRLNFAGNALAHHLLPALEHLRVDNAVAPDLSLHLWDSDSTGVAMIPPPVPRDLFTDRGDIWGYTSRRFKLAFHWTECSVNLMDLERGVGVYWVQSPDSLPSWVNASPLRTLFHWWMEKNGLQLLHAAAVGTEDGALLITGKGGVGKSTTALACLAAGMTYLADDYVIVGLEGKPTVYSLYSTAKLNVDQMRKFPQLGCYVGNREKVNDPKAVMYLYPDFRDRIVLSAPLIGVATPRVSGQPGTSFSPASPHTLRRAVAFTTLSQLPYAGRQTLEFINRLIDRVTGLELSAGTDLKRLPETIREFLRDPAPLVERCRKASVPKDSKDFPLISVIIPVYNGAQFIPDAINNVMSQNYPALEIIMVDDGSTDSPAGVVEGLNVDVRYFEQPNSGAAAARNRGIKDASGDYITFLDVDDLWPEHNLITLLDALRGEPDLHVVHGYGQLMALDPDTKTYEYVGNPEESYPYYIGAGLYRRSAFERVGLFDTELQFAEDTDWYKRANEVGIGIKRVNEVTLLVRRHGNNMTQGKSLVELNTLRVFKKALDRSRHLDEVTQSPQWRENAEASTGGVAPGGVGQ
jgi:GT2 family glycosyltransferase